MTKKNTAINEPELDRGLPESEKGIGPGGIGEGKRCDGRRQQDDASGRLDVEEAFEGTDEAVDRLAGEDSAVVGIRHGG
jgi:hypothetical protein